MMQALIFDCDGVLVDTERDGHRVAFNTAFRSAGLSEDWSVDRYGELLTTGGGKERMRRHFDEAGWPAEADRDALILGLHHAKTNLSADLWHNHLLNQLVALANNQPIQRVPTVPN